MTGKFKYIGTGFPPVNYNSRFLKPGDEVELGINQFAELRNQFEPLDDEAKSIAAAAQLPAESRISANLRGHERRGMLEQEKKKHEEALKAIEAALGSLDQAGQAPPPEGSKVPPEKKSE